MILAASLSFYTILSAVSLYVVFLILRSADRISFPATYLPFKAPPVPIPEYVDTYTPLDWKGLA